MFNDRLVRSRSTFLWNLYCNRRFSVFLVLVLSLIAGPALVLDAGLSAGWFDEVMALILLAVVVAGIVSMILAVKVRSGTAAEA